MTEIPQHLLGRRAALTGVGIALGILGIVIAIPIMAAYTSENQVRNDYLRQLAVFRAESAMRSELEAELNSLRQRGLVAPGLIAAESVPLAQAQLERDVKAIVDANGGEIHSAQVGAPSRVGDLDVVLVQYNLSIPAARLGALVYAIETHTPYFFIDHADIAAPAGWQTGISSAPTAPKLEVRWTVRAYRWGAK